MWITVLHGEIGAKKMASKFVLTPIKRQHTQNKKGETVRVHKDAYNILVDMTNESTFSMSQIASKAIMFAYEHLEYGYENKEEE